MRKECSAYIDNITSENISPGDSLSDIQTNIYKKCIERGGVGNWELINDIQKDIDEIQEKLN